MQAKYPPNAYRGVRARLVDWVIGVPYARYLERAVCLLQLRDGDSVCDIACGPGYNLSRLVHAVGPDGLVTAVEDNPHLLSRAQKKVERAGWQNVRLLPALEPERILRVPVDGMIIGYNPPIVLQRRDLLDAAWAILKSGGRLSAVGARCTTPAGRLAGPLIKLGLTLLGHPRDWHYWTVHEPWRHLEELSGGKTSVEPKLGFEYVLCAGKDQGVNGSSRQGEGPHN
jgi:SAM-dependent methyltransferase